ncbi:GspH/FimT family pseudopilin [Shewanella piezotolerans]|nr:GspH/FimT family pseudopilin [Shewanella piezotolerans]
MLKQDQGFTLIECMVTLVILTILLSVSIPSLSTVYAQVRASLSIKEIKQSIQLARSYAISYGQRVTVCPLTETRCNSNWGNNISVFSDSGESNHIDGTDQLLFTIGPFDSRDFVQYNRRAIRFLPSGLASGTNGTLTYCPESLNSQYSAAIIVSQSGRSRFSNNKTITCK